MKTGIFLLHHTKDFYTVHSALDIEATYEGLRWNLPKAIYSGILRNLYVTYGMPILEVLAECSWSEFDKLVEEAKQIYGEEYHEC